MDASIGVRTVLKSVVRLPGLEHRFLVCPCVAYHCSYWLNYLESKNNGRGNKGEKEMNQKGIKLKICLSVVYVKYDVLYVCTYVLVRCACDLYLKTRVWLSYLKVTIFFKSERVLNLCVPGRLRPLACWDWEFEPRRGPGCLSLVSVVCRHVQVSASGWLSPLGAVAPWRKK